MRTDDPALFAAFGDAARAVGTHSFYDALLDVAGTLVCWQLRMVMRYSRHSAPSYLVSEGLAPLHMQLYLAGLYRVDPFYRYCREDGRGGVLTARAVGAPDARDSDYFDVFLPLTGMADDLVVLLPSVGRSAIGLLYERPTPFSRRDVATLRRVYPALLGLHRAHQRSLLSGDIGATATGGGANSGRAYLILDADGRRLFASDRWQEAARRHPEVARFDRAAFDPKEGQWRLSADLSLHAERLDADSPLAPGGWICLLDVGEPSPPPVSFRAAFDRFLAGELTPRERQIVRLILSGYPSAKIAERLGISVGTVKNHRKRLYYKLDITTERELFGRFLAQLTEAGSSPPEE